MAKKIGENSFQAFLRHGLAEARQAVSLGGNVEQPVPYGMYGNPLPSEAAKGDWSSDHANHHYQSFSHAATPANANLPTPSQVIDNPKAYSPETGNTHGQAKEHCNASALPTPSQVIDNPAAYRPEPSPGQERQHEQGRTR